MVFEKKYGIDFYLFSWITMDNYMYSEQFFEQNYNARRYEYKLSVSKILRCLCKVNSMLFLKNNNS